MKKRLILSIGLSTAILIGCGSSSSEDSVLSDEDIHEKILSYRAANKCPSTSLVTIINNTSEDCKVPLTYLEKRNFVVADKDDWWRVVLKKDGAQLLSPVKYEFIIDGIRSTFGVFPDNSFALLGGAFSLDQKDEAYIELSTGIKIIFNIDEGQAVKINRPWLHKNSGGFNDIFIEKIVNSSYMIIHVTKKGTMFNSKKIPLKYFKDGLSVLNKY